MNVAEHIVRTVTETRAERPGVHASILWVWCDEPITLLLCNGLTPEHWPGLAVGLAARLPAPVNGVAVSAEAFAMLDAPPEMTDLAPGDLAELSMFDERIVSVIQVQSWTPADGFSTTICPFVVADDGRGVFDPERVLSTAVPSSAAQTAGDPWHETVAAVYATLL